MYKPDPNAPLLFDTTDKYGKRIFLETSRYNEHIVDGHEEMLGNVKAIQDSIEKPRLILQSPQFPNRWLYIGKSKNSTYPVMDIKTIVDHTNPDYGAVVTSLFQRKINVEKEGARIIYEKEDKN